MPRFFSDITGSDDLNFRLAVILRLLQTSAVHGLDVTPQLQRQLNAIRVLVESSSEAAASLARCAGDVACEMSSLEEGAKLTKWVKTVSAVAAILPQDGTSLLRSRLEVVRQFVERVRGLHESLATMRMSWSKFTEWWYESVLRAKIPEFRAVTAIFAEVEVWPRVAKGINSETYAACAAKLTALSPGKYSESHYYEEALLLDPNCLSAIEGLARLHYRRSDYLTAWNWYKRALDSGSVNPATYNRYAWIAASQPQLSLFDQRTVWAAERAVAAMPIAEIWDTLAEVRERQGDLTGALDCAQEALRDDGDRAEYQQRLQRLSQLKGRTGRKPDTATRSNGPPPTASKSLIDELADFAPNDEQGSQSPSTDRSNGSWSDPHATEGEGFLLYPSQERDDEAGDDDV